MDIKAKTSTTFTSTLSSAIGLRTMAKEAQRVSASMDGVSASHYLAWNNLSAALLAQAAEVEAVERLRDLTGDHGGDLVRLLESAATQLAEHTS